MTLKDKVLLALYRAFPNELSGERLAEQTGVSRAAVWKAVEALRREGAEIVSSTGKGYGLASLRGRLCVPCIEEALREIDPGFAVLSFEVIDSTNAEAKRRLAAGRPAPMLLLAYSQEAGRGRLGRDFFSPEGGLYLTLALSDVPLLSGGVRYTSAAALAAAEAMEAFLPEPVGIKWVNDLYYREKKVAGILTEGIFDMETSQLNHLVLGIGINASEVDFPVELQDKAGSIPLADADRTELVILLVRKILEYFSRIGDPDFFEGYRRRCFLLGREVRFQKEGRAFTGKAAAIDDWGGLIVETDEGRMTLQSGEVFLKEEVSADFQLRAQTLRQQ